MVTALPSAQDAIQSPVDPGLEVRVAPSTRRTRLSTNSDPTATRGAATWTGLPIASANPAMGIVAATPISDGKAHLRSARDRAAQTSHNTAAYWKKARNMLG